MSCEMTDRVGWPRGERVLRDTPEEHPHRL